MYMHTFVQVFGAAEEKKKTNVDRVTESTDGPALSSVATSGNLPLMLYKPMRYIIL